MVALLVSLKNFLGKNMNKWVVIIVIAAHAMYGSYMYGSERMPIPSLSKQELRPDKLFAQALTHFSRFEQDGRISTFTNAVALFDQIIRTKGITMDYPALYNNTLRQLKVWEKDFPKKMDARKIFDSQDTFLVFLENMDQHGPELFFIKALSYYSFFKQEGKTDYLLNAAALLDVVTGAEDIEEEYPTLHADAVAQLRSWEREYPGIIKLGESGTTICDETQ
jgi:hypothetical protein